MINTVSAQLYAFSPVDTAFVRAMYKKGAGNDKQGKDVGNQTLCPHRNFSQAIIDTTACGLRGTIIINIISS